MKKVIKYIIYFFLKKIYGNKVDTLTLLLNATPGDNLLYNRNTFFDSRKSECCVIYPKYNIISSEIQDYTYISRNSVINNTQIGKFCSIGPNFVCGWGIHPTDTLSTAPMFYSTIKQNGTTLSDKDKVEETKPIKIGNDVFIGMNVSVLDGVTIGDGAIIGAGAIVSKDIPPYAIAVGNPIRILKYRFDDDIIKKLLEIKWWNWDLEKLKDVEMYFDNVDDFVRKHYKKYNDK